MAGFSNEKRRLRVASYNIRKCIGLDRRRNPARSLAVINHLQADIVALQEADRRLGTRPAALPRHLLETGSDFVPAPVATHPGSLGWHGNAILLQRGLAPVTMHRLALPGLEPRGAVIVDVIFPGTTEPLRVVGVHLGLMRRHRLKQLAWLRRHLDQLPVARTVILGDFNEWSSQRGMAPLEDHFTIHTPGRSYHAAHPVGHLDRIATGPGIRLLDSGVLDQGAAQRASDHLPIWADIELDI